MSVKNVVGNVLRIERSSLFDGDGLRTVLFLKGCPLRCLWCSTPESQHSGFERGIIRDKCTVCGKCVEACAHSALSIIDSKLIFDRSKCVGCFKCADVCPNSAVVPYGKLMTAEDAIREIVKDEVFYFHSGGGVTISGGEPLAQSKFVTEVLKGCCERGISCAIESSFYARKEDLDRVLPYLSLVYADIKDPISEQHEQLTGVPNEIILDNIRYADESKHKFDLVIRTPVVPGLNDSDEAITALAFFVKGLKKLRFMEFLAYHRLGTETYKRMEIPYALEDMQTPAPEHMRERAEYFRKLAGVPVKINGHSI